MQAIAQNVKQRRQRRGLSLSELARLAGISKSTLSALERAQGNPAIDTLWSVANALNVPLSGLFEDGKGPGIAVTLLEDAPLVAMDSPGIEVRHVQSRHDRGDFEVYVVDFVDGAKRNALPHPPGNVEHVIVMAGHFDVGPDRAGAVLAPGDCITFLADGPHHYHSLDGPGRLLVIHDYP